MVATTNDTFSLSAENKDLPPFRRNSYISAYGEGWALYTERLGDEMGFYRDPYERFGMLSYQMWRAARLVIDTGLHAKGWTRDRALAFFRDNTALSEREITTEVDRYIGWPALPPVRPRRSTIRCGVCARYSRATARS